MNAFDRNTNLTIIGELRNSEKITLDSYIDKVLIPLGEQNPIFCETLYKDIIYVLSGVDKEGDNDLMIENGDLVIENGDLKLTGYQTSLHDIMVWLHMEGIKKIESESKLHNDFMERLEIFNNDILTNSYYTPEYRVELDKIKSSLKKERKYNYENHKSGFKKYFDIDILELKPNFCGLGINLNEIINRIRKK